MQTAWRAYILNFHHPTALKSTTTYSGVKTKHDDITTTTTTNDGAHKLDLRDTKMMYFRHVCRAARGNAKPT